jgi:hypothetical protein
MSKKNIIDIEIEGAEREKLLDMYKTARVKAKFINELKTGLGKDIKSNPSKVKIIKKTWYQKIATIIKNIFTKF